VSHTREQFARYSLRSRVKSERSVPVAAPTPQVPAHSSACHVTIHSCWLGQASPLQACNSASVVPLYHETKLFATSCLSGAGRTERAASGLDCVRQSKQHVARSCWRGAHVEAPKAAQNVQCLRDVVSCRSLGIRYGVNTARKKPLA